MGIQYTIESEGKLIYAVGQGEISEEDLFAYRDALRADLRIGPGMIQIVDLSETKQSEISSEALTRLASSVAKDKELIGDWKIAYVVQSDLHYGLVRMYRSYVEIYGTVNEARVFYHLAEACDWLGIEKSLLTEKSL